MRIAFLFGPFSSVALGMPSAGSVYARFLIARSSGLACMRTGTIRIAGIEMRVVTAEEMTDMQVDMGGATMVVVGAAMGTMATDTGTVTATEANHAHDPTRMSHE